MEASEFHIRAYQPADEQAVINLWQAAGLLAPQNHPQKDIARKLKVNPDWFLLGLLNDRVIASCMVGYEGHRGWINYLAVQPDLQGKGYGQRIMQEAERILKAAGCPKINLQVRSSNTQVINFYKNLGFNIDEVTSMGKRLEPDPPYSPKAD